MDISKLKNENGPRPRRHSTQQVQNAADTLVTEQSAAPESTDTTAESSTAEAAEATSASPQQPTPDAATNPNQKTCPLHISEYGHFPPCAEATCAWYDTTVKACAVLAQTKPPHSPADFLPRTMTLD